MALDSTPWLIGGGAEHSPEVARSFAYAATLGAEGVVGVSDLRVAPQSVPNGTVQVFPGAGVCLNRYAGGGQQSYIARNQTNTTVTIRATGSGGGRRDMVVLRVLDPQYEGSAPSNPTEFDYARLVVIEGVSANAKTARDLGLPYPAIALAAIQLPASTGTITAGMITDLRRVANPRRDLVVDSAYWQDSIVNVDSASFKYLGRSTDFFVPEWATAAKVLITWGGVGITGGKSDGWLRGKFGTGASGVELRATYWDENPNTIGNDRYERGTYLAAAEFRIPAGMRGTSQYIELQGQRVHGPGILQMRYGTSVAFLVEFSEVAY